MRRTVVASLVAVPETSGSALYGMVDVLSAVGSLWGELMRRPAAEAGTRLDIRIVAPTPEPFLCGNGIPVAPYMAVDACPATDIVILPELWIGPDEPMRGRHPSVMDWIRRMYARGAALYSACSGSVMLAETGLVDHCQVTSHWAYRELFQAHYPAVRFLPEPTLTCADPAGRIVTAGGTTSWHDLAIHIIARHAGAAEAVRIAKIYLLKLHPEGQRPWLPLVRDVPHGDGAVRRCQVWLADHFLDDDALAGAVRHSGLPQRTLKRRFKAATGSPLIQYIQNLRIEHARELLETTRDPVDDIAHAAGYEDASFFRLLFRRMTGLSPAQYRRMFQAAALQGVERRGTVGIKELGVSSRP